MKKKTWAIAAIVVGALSGAFFLGPRVRWDVSVPRVSLDSNLDGYLRAKESAIASITPGTEKAISWFGRPGEPTPIAVVYLHGFTGTRQELVPVMELASRRLGANLYCTRYAGHGCGPEAIAAASLQDWVDDTAEAFAIGRRMGRRVAVVAMSTAAPLALWLSTAWQAPDVMVLLSPNFAPADPMAGLLLLPWGNAIVKLAVGPYNEFKVVNERHARYSTPRYRSEALLTMMAAVELGRRAPLETFEAPLLCLYSGKDDVVSLDKMKAAFRRIGSGQKELREIKAATGHVLGGDTHSPASTDELVSTLCGFVESALTD